MKRLGLLVASLVVAAGCGEKKVERPDSGPPECGCPAGQRCIDGVCGCDSLSCADGCCNGENCVLPIAQSANACGAGGAQCSVCSGLTPTCSAAGACTDECGPGQGACEGGCCQNGHCLAGGADDACGPSGGDCVDCAGSQLGGKCVSGRCGCALAGDCPGGGTCDPLTLQCACGPANCNGCCDPATGACVTPTSSACGANGSTCQTCGAGQLCSASGACACDATSCPNGCCNAATCVAFDTQTVTSCGSGGLACGSCAAGQACLGGQCVCNAASCPGGCCSAGVCIGAAAQSEASCGTAGATCAACGSGQRCSAGQCLCDAASCASGCCDAAGACQAGTAAAVCGTGGAVCQACGAGKRCQGGGCVCDSTSCATGCCDATGACQTAGTTAACGTGGATCASCGTGQACVGGSCVCNAASCPGGCCNGDVCVATSAQSNGQCGSGGAACGACSGLLPTCSGGTCTAVCGGAGQGTCSGGCCGGGSCQAGSAAVACGTTGSVCTDCTGAALGHACVAGHCGCNGNPDCPTGSVCNPATSTCGACNPASCPAGCCDATGTCQTGGGAGACGSGGAACQTCAATQACVAGACACTAGSCPTGCCNGTDCVAPGSQSAAQCGTGGLSCANCASNPQGTACVGGGCGCGSAADCPSGSVCSTATGRCVAGGGCASGPCNGCCAGGVCTAGGGTTACGAGGGACVDCVATQPLCRSGAACNAGSCGYTTQTSGSCELAYCTVGELCDASGVCSGGTPRDCSGGDACLTCTCSNAGAGSCNCSNRAASAASSLTVTSTCLTAGTGARLAAVLRLVDAAGTPLTGATVTFTAPGAAWDEAGAVEVANPPGTYYRTLAAPAGAGSLTVSASVTACSASTAITQTRTVTIAAAAPATGFGGAAFQGVRGCSPVGGHLRVKVIAEETGAPIGGASVMVGAAQGTPLVATAAALFPTAAPAGSNVATTDAQGVVELLDFGATLRGPLTVTAGAAGRATVTYEGWNGADQVIALPLRRPVVTTHSASGTASSRPAKTNCTWMAAGFALQDTPLDALAKFDLGSMFGPNKCVDTGLAGVIAVPENIYAPAQTLGTISWLCLANLVESPWRVDAKAGQRVLDMPYVQIPVSAAQSGNLVTMVQGAQFLEIGFQQPNVTGPLAGSIFNLDNTYPDSVTFNYSNQPAQTDITGLALLDYDGTGSGRLGIAGVNIDRYTDVSPVVARIGGLTGTPAGTRYVGAVVASYYTTQVPGRSIPADRDSAKSTTFVRGTAGAPPFAPGASSVVTVNNFLGLSPAVVAGGTTFRFGDAANAGQVPQYSVSTLAIEHSTWLPRQSCETSPGTIVARYPQWIVIRPRTAPSATCPGFTSTVTGCESFTLPALPASFPEATAAAQKQSGFQQRVGSATACAGTCPVAGELCVVPTGTTLPARCMGQEASSRYFTESYAWTLENRALGLTPTAVTATSADFTQWRPGLTQTSSNNVGF